MSATHHVALATDHRYARHAAAVVLSACRADPDVVAHVLAAPDLTDVDHHRLQGLAPDRVVVHRVQEDALRGLPTTPRLGLVMWYRLLLPQLLPDLSRVLYLDADTMVVDRLDEVFATALDGAALAAVHNVMEPGRRDHVAGLGLDHRRYFNSGVLLLDLDALRAGRQLDEVIALAVGREDLAFPDQDALNLVLGPTRVALHPRWNAQNSVFAWPRLSAEVFGAEPREEAVARPGILHFEGPGAAKPWHRASRHPWRRAYRELAAQTPWGPLTLESTPWRRQARMRAYGAWARLFRRDQLPS